MPLLDHFHPPLSQRRHWDSFHGAWAEAIAIYLNESLLPPRYVAEARVNLGGRVEVDVASFEEGRLDGSSEGGVAVWSPPKPTLTLPLDDQTFESFEVIVLNDEEGPTVVACVELVSPANKDRPAHRRQFVTKCASYLHAQASVVIVDVVTSRSGNLQQELLSLLGTKMDVKQHALYASALRIRPSQNEAHLDVWSEGLALGQGLPTLPLWISPEHAVPLDLEETYQRACAARRID